MIPTTKISHTILEFGRSLITSLPSEHSKEELEATMKIVITAWNAVVMDSWENGNKYESMLLEQMKQGPKIGLVEVKRLIKRKKVKFASDPRAVGNHWVTERNGEFIFRCEARLNVENAEAEDVFH